MHSEDYSASRRSYLSRRKKQRKRQIFLRVLIIIFIILLLLAAIAAGVFWFKNNEKLPLDQTSVSDASEQNDILVSDIVMESKPSDEVSVELNPAQASDDLQTLLGNAEALALTYDYDKAIACLSESEYAESPEVTEAIASYEKAKSTLVRVDPTEVTHIFFHSLIMDNQKAFDGDADEAGYNQVMTTSREFLKILEQMYEHGYVLVRIHDLAYEILDENGKTKMVPGDIMLPPGKKPFIMSQDDVCYYDYMTGDGFASRIIVGEDGKPTCEMLMDDGSISVGSYDLVPLLEDFITEHPDFSYKGARAILAFTGYEGILGYRTDPEYADTNPNYEQDLEAARQVAQCLRDNGWELASHSWGHINMGSRDLSSVKTDADKWESRVESIIGETDIILYPFGSDINDWHPYNHDNAKFDYLHDLGFRYFCNVDSNPYWVQIGSDFVRQGRRNLDGYRMYYDLPETNPDKDHLSDLFDVTTVFDPDRPTPVPPM